MKSSKNLYRCTNFLFQNEITTKIYIDHQKLYAILHENDMKMTGKKKLECTKQNSMNEHYIVFVFLCL